MEERERGGGGNIVLLIWLVKTEREVSEGEGHGIPDITMQQSRPVRFMERYAASARAKICGSLSYISLPR